MTRLLVLTCPKCGADLTFCWYPRGGGLYACMGTIREIGPGMLKVTQRGCCWESNRAAGPLVMLA